MLSDSEAIATWERAEPPDPNQIGHAPAYRCTECDWHGRGETALRHFRAAGHAIRGRNWPANWPNAQFTPFATFAHEQDDFKGSTLRMFTIHGGEYDRSTVTRDTLSALGITDIR